MIQRLNNYLLTRYPLLWNTRLLWVAATNLLLHILFFIAGMLAVDAVDIAHYYSISNVSGGNHYTLSILCGMVVMIVWCIFYLRNNAFKSHYRIGRWYLAREFAIICFIILSSITYFMSFEWGIRVKVRSFTNEVQMVQEINTVNKAAVYIANDKAPYFILNTCAERNQRIRNNQQKINVNNAQQYDDNYVDTTVAISVDTYYEPDEYTSIDSNSLYNYKDSARILTALRRSDAFSYLHYCRQFISIGYSNTDAAEAISQRNQRWLQQNHKDSVAGALQAMYAVLNKYGVEYRLSADSIVKDVFSDSLFTMSATIPANPDYNRNGEAVKNQYYLNDNDIHNVFNFIEDCQPGNQSYFGQRFAWNFVGYTTLSLSILLLCYRRFSRKVFLISTIGTLVWAILLGLLAVSNNSIEGFAIIVLVLCGIFLAAGLYMLWQNRGKITSGVLLNWHVYLSPYVVLLITAVIEFNYNRHMYVNSTTVTYEQFMQQHYPVSYWVGNHLQEIFLVNLVVSFLYVALLFNSWAKRWQVMAEE